MHYFRFWWEATKEAARGSFDRANALSAVIGGLLLWLGLWLTGLQMEAPTSVTGVVGFGAATATTSVVATWIAVLALRLIGAPARLLGKANERIADLERINANLVDASKSRLELSFDRDHYGVVVEDDDLKQILSIGIRNAGNTNLEQCQLQVRAISHDGLPSTRSHFSVCKPFMLRPDERVFKGIFDYSFDKKDSPIRLHAFVRNDEDGQWYEPPGDWELIPGRWDLSIEALSANTRKAVLMLYLQHEGGHWHISLART